MNTTHAALLLAAGFAAGVVNALAGGASIFLYPLLLALGIPPITANATTSVVVLPGALSSAYGYRSQLARLDKRYFLLLLPCLVGGLIGAILLNHTSNHTFSRIVPWFILAAVILLSQHDRIHKWVYSRRGRRLERLHPTVAAVIMGIAFMLATIYGGYFGGGLGLMILALLATSPLTDINQMNGLKNLIAVATNATAIAYFAVSGLIYWPVLPLLVIGNIAGGLMGSTYGERLPQALIRRLITIIGVVVTVVIFANVYL